MGIEHVEHVALIGPTGSGKVTTQSLISRIARDRDVKVAEILAEGTRVSLDTVLPTPQTPAHEPLIALRRDDVIFSGTQTCGTVTIELPKPYIVPKTGWYLLRLDPPRIEPIEPVSRETEQEQSSGEDTQP